MLINGWATNPCGEIILSTASIPYVPNNKIKILMALFKKPKNFIKMFNFKDLKKGWDSYDADPISFRTIENSLLLLAEITLGNIFISPSVDGEIQFDFGNNVELFVDSNVDKKNRYESSMDGFIHGGFSGI
tara:strand:- start:256 stop:648 length:393 start_codon:yes stop_codon:yes gene_type:complete